MYLRENEFDKYFEKASAHVGLPTSMLKAICATESAFVPTVFNMAHDKIGLSGMTPDTARKVLVSIGGNSAHAALRDPESNILLLGYYLRFLYNHLADVSLFPKQGGVDPDYFDVVRQYCRDNNSGEPGPYTARVWQHYKYFCEKSGEPHSYRADEVEGTYIRNKETMLL